MPEPKTYRWCRIEHPERAFWGVPERMPWPVECESKPDPRVGYPAGDMREGIRRLRAEGGTEWTEEWAVLEKFCDAGDELSGLIERNEIEPSLKILDGLESLRPGTAYCPFNRAFLLRVSGDLAGARAAIIEASERAPRVEWIWTRRAELHEEQGETKDAIFCFRKALALLPNHQQALEGLARHGAMCRLQVTFPDGRRQVSFLTPDDFRRKIAADIAASEPDDPILRAFIPQFLGGGPNHKADLALLAIDRILATLPPDALALRMQRADALRLLQRFDEAHEILDGILAGESPNNAQALYVQAWCYFDEKMIPGGWECIDEALEADPNHEDAIKVKFGLGRTASPGTVERLTAWAEQKKSWRGYYCAAIQCSTQKDRPGCLRCAEAAYRLAPHERDALFIYANSLNSAEEGEYTAALIHPRLPKLKGDYILKFIFAGAMKKLGLEQEAIRILRESLEEGRSAMKADMLEATEHFLDSLTGLLATGDIRPEFFPNTPTLRRSIWVATDEGPQSCLIDYGQSAPVSGNIKLEPRPGFTGTTGSIGFLLRHETSDLDPVNLGWFRVHDIDYSSGPRPLFTLRVTGKGKLEGLACQGDRRLPVTWSLYRVPSMEMETPEQD